MAEQKPEFPVAKMPRMGRRNAITPSDPDSRQEEVEVVTTSYPTQQNSLGKENTNPHVLEEQYVLVETNQPHVSQDAPLADNWKRIADAVTKVEALLDSREGAKYKQKLGVTGPIQNRIPEMLEENHKIIPWKNQDANQTTIAAERRKMFESFNKTSIEPPETPEVSESKLRRMMSKIKRKKKEKSNQPQSDSEESLDFRSSTPPNGKAKGKAQYSNIRPKVNTRWNKYEELNKWKQQQQEEEKKLAKNQAMKLLEKELKAGTFKDKKTSKSVPGIKAVVKKPGPVVKSKVMGKRETTTVIMKPKAFGDSPELNASVPLKPSPKSKRLVTNYPAAETVKNTTAKLPLTIGPRFNARKAMGMGIANAVQNRAELVGDQATRLYGAVAPTQKLKYEFQQQHHQNLHGVHASEGGASYKSTFFNLHRINNGGMMNTKNLGEAIGQFVVVRTPRPGGVGHIISVETKKPAPPLTTIQAPPSPFMTSNISIPSQLNVIPVNGEVTMTPMMPDKSQTSNKSEKSSRRSKSKRNTNAGGNKVAVVGGGNNKIQQQPPQQQQQQPLPNRTANNTNAANSNPPKLTGKPAKSNSPSPGPPPGAVPKANATATVATAADAPPTTNKVTVVPTLGNAPNKYNNIYIGPYSGSESEGEQPNFNGRR